MRRRDLRLPVLRVDRVEGPVSDVVREFRVVDRLGYPYTEPLALFEARDAMSDLAERYQVDGPFHLESRTVTDWLSVETEQARR